MITDLPFYKNDGDGNQCLQVCGKIVIKHFLDRDCSLDELDELTGRKAGLWTYTPQIVSILDDVGLKTKFYSKENLEPFLEGEAFYRRHFGKDADEILKHTDIPEVSRAIGKLLDYDGFENRKISIGEIEGHVGDGHVVLVLIDNNKISGEGNFYRGHAVVVTGFDDENIYYHDSGPRNAEANKKVRKEVFVEAMDANGTDNDCVVVFGKK